MIRRLPFVVLLIAFAVLPVPAQNKPEKKAAPPRLVMAQPLAVMPGTTTKLTVRGLNLDGITAVRFHEPKSTGKLLGKPGKVGVPNAQMTAIYGDMAIDIEAMVPDAVPGGWLSFALVSEAGESNPLRVAIDDGTPRIAEKEPNNGFRQAQPLPPLPITVEGTIQTGQDVDVFRLSGEKGERLTFEVQAARFGSPADLMLTLFDSAGNTVAAAESREPGQDARLDVTLPTAGAYFLALTDAHDSGSNLHVYRLLCRRR